MAYAAKTIATRLTDGMLWINTDTKPRHTTQSSLDTKTYFPTIFLTLWYLHTGNTSTFMFVPRCLHGCNNQMLHQSPLTHQADTRSVSCGWWVQKYVCTNPPAGCSWISVILSITFQLCLPVTQRSTALGLSLPSGYWLFQNFKFLLFFLRHLEPPDGIKASSDRKGGTSRQMWSHGLCFLWTPGNWFYWLQVIQNKT